MKTQNMDDAEYHKKVNDLLKVILNLKPKDWHPVDPLNERSNYGIYVSRSFYVTIVDDEENPRIYVSLFHWIDPDPQQKPLVLEYLKKLQQTWKDGNRRRMENLLQEFTKKKII
jgi:hypothetical protein